MIQQVESLELGFFELIRHLIEFKGRDVGREEGTNVGGEEDRDEDEREEDGEEVTLVEGELETSSDLRFQLFDVETGSWSGRSAWAGWDLAWEVLGVVLVD